MDYLTGTVKYENPDNKHCQHSFRDEKPESLTGWPAQGSTPHLCGKLRCNLALSSFKAQVLTSRLSQIVLNTLVAIIRNLALHLPVNGEATQELNK